MAERTWTINGLANEFGLDRRTVTARLKPVTPYSKRTLRNGNVERRFRLKDASPYLTRPAPDHDREAARSLKLWVAHEFYPAVVQQPEFVRLLTGYCTGALKLSKPQALDVYRTAAGALLVAIQAAFEADDIKCKVPADSVLQDLIGKSSAQLEVYAARNWPDAA